MRMTWATQPAAFEIAGIVAHAGMEPVWLSRSRWPWHLQNPHFQIWDPPKPVVKVLTWSDDTIFIKAPNGYFLLLCRSSIRGRAITCRAFQTDDCTEPGAGCRFLSRFSPVVKLDILSLHISPVDSLAWESCSLFWSRILCALQILYFEESVIRGDFSHQYFMPSIRCVFSEGWWRQGRAAHRGTSTHPTSN